ncbi:MAG: hypothetical protein CMH54_14995 [Myxococcales bacterium]|nr:hypothetical protein [Myxococcales bacterium]
MKTMIRRAGLVAALLCFFAACAGDSQTATDTSATDTNVEVCDSNRTPVVMIHGFLGAGDNYGWHTMRFTANGYCPESLFVFDWNTLEQTDQSPDLAAFIADVIEETGAEQVDLIAHSAGCALSYAYLGAEENAALVRRFVYIDFSPQESLPGPDGEVTTLALWAESSATFPGEDPDAEPVPREIPGAENITLPGSDHYSVATSEDSFVAIYSFLNDGEEPQTTAFVSEDEVTVAGRAVSFGENAPLAGGVVEIYTYDPQTGVRSDAGPVYTITTDEEGHWGPIQVEPGVHYEFWVQPLGEGEMAVHYFPAPFVRSNPFVYLRTMPPPTSFAGLLLGILPRTAEGANVVVFMQTRVLNAATDDLLIDGHQVATPEVASIDKSTVALFLFDSNDDGSSDLTSVGLFEQFPFLNALDIFFSADPQRGIAVQLNEYQLTVPSVPSEEGAMVLMLP